jgi:RNA polymerase sigma-70 factor, ECF subfamily
LARAGVYWVKLQDMTESSGHWCHALYEHKAAALVLYGRALGLSHSEAEDVLQETFVALLQRKDAPENPEHYCVRSFRNRALNYRRSMWRRITRELESHRWFEPGEGESPDECRMMECLRRLPPEQREVIVLKIWHEYTFEAIGEVLDISPNTAAGRYRYGIQKLKLAMKGNRYERDQPVGKPVAILGATPAIE